MSTDSNLGSPKRRGFDNSPRTWLRRMSLGWLLTGLTLAGVCAMALRSPLDPDMFWHLRVGEWQIENQQPMTRDPFSHTRAGELWINHSWLAQYFLYWLHSAFGYAGLGWYVAIAAMLSMALVAAQSQGDAFVRAIAIVVASASAASFWVPRPQMFSFVFGALVMYLLWLYKEHDRDYLWAIPIIMGVWVNLHGGFTLGFVILGIATAVELLHWLGAKLLPDSMALAPDARNAHGTRSQQALLRYGGVIGLSLLATSLNPFGPRILLVTFETIGREAEQNVIQEWASPNFHQSLVWPFMALLLVTLATPSLTGQRLTLYESALVAAFGVMALLAGRNISLFSLVAPQIVIPRISTWLMAQGYNLGWDRLPRSHWIGVLNLWLLLLAFSGCVYKASLAFEPGLLEQARKQRFPVDALEYLKANDLPPKLYNSYNWGGYMLWADPSIQVYIDSRTDLYGDEVLLPYLKVYFAQPGWEDALSRNEMNTVLVESDSLIARVMLLSDDWEPKYQDEVASIFVRR